MATRTVSVLAAAAAFWFATAPAAAQKSSPAEQAFREGRKLAGEGRWAEACDKFEESQRIEPAAGTLLNLADCYDKLDRTASAWTAFRAVEDQSRRAGVQDRADEAKRRAEALEPRLMRLHIAITENIDGLEVRVDGKPATSMIGAAVPVDPGEHRIEARAPAHRPFEHVVTMTQSGHTEKVTIPVLERDAGGSPSRRPPVGEPAVDEPGERHMTALTWSLAAASGVSLGVGLYLGISAYGDVRDCRDAGGCPSEEERDRIHTRFVIGDVLVGTAIASGAVAALLYWRSGNTGPETAVSVSISREFQGLVITEPF